MEMLWEYNNEWQHIKQIGHITRHHSKKVQGEWKVTQEEVYIITSLRSTINAEELLKINRGNWSVENNIHWVRDVVLREDACTVNKRVTAHVLSALHNIVIACIKKISNAYTATREMFAHKPHKAFKLLFCP